MEIVLAVFIGLWLSFFSVWAYLRLKKEYKDQVVTPEKEDEKK